MQNSNKFNKSVIYVHDNDMKEVHRNTVISHMQDKLAYCGRLVNYSCRCKAFILGMPECLFTSVVFTSLLKFEFAKQSEESCL